MWKKLDEELDVLWNKIFVHLEAVIELHELTSAPNCEDFLAYTLSMYYEVWPPRTKVRMFSSWLMGNQRLPRNYIEGAGDDVVAI